jgi:hypothetical protein
MAEAVIFDSQSLDPHPDYPIMLLDALRITCPDFDERDISNNHLTFNETAIISMYAGFFRNIGDLRRAIEINGKLYRNLVVRYADEVARSRIFSAVIMNYSSCLGEAGMLDEALAIINEGIQFERNHVRLTMLSALFYNKGYGLFMLGKESECIPYMIPPTIHEYLWVFISYITSIATTAAPAPRPANLHHGPTLDVPTRLRGADCPAA